MNTLWPGNGHVIQAALETDDPATGERVPATGLTVSGWISLTDGGPAVGGLTVALTEYGGVPGTYHGTLTGAALTTALAAIADGTILYEVVVSATDILVSTPIEFRRVRRGSEAEQCA